jgi:hypothetical protein
VAHRLAEIVRIAARAAASEEFAGKWCNSISAARSFFEDESAKAREVCILPARTQEPNVLVRVDWDSFGSPADLDEFSLILQSELGPFIEGVGYVIAENAPEGGIIIRRDASKIFDIHGVNPPNSSD